MRVVRVTRFGGPEVLVVGEAPDPVAGSGQVVVEVAVAGMTFVETRIRAGTDPWHAPPELPYVPGGVVAGRVGEIGPDVDPGWSGRRVLAETGDEGGFAERALAAVADLIPVPDGLDLAGAVALHTDGSTAAGLVEGARIRAGEWVLVEAAAGGVGTLLVQLAVAVGARVVGAARGARKLDLVRELGAAAAVDYSEPDWTRQLLRATGGAGPDVVFDGVGGEIGRAAFATAARGGRFSVHGGSGGPATEIDPAEAGRRGVEVIGIEQLSGFGPHMRRWAGQVMSAAVAGRLRPVIGQTYPLERAADAHAAVQERRSTGKTLLLVRPRARRR
ncbi:zinc-binding dehydrogenase [Pseudonocardia humida]|uniref:Zinc-binding dehydrogenase n=1 Tax=Pseudonocardia humida TaxID=2800819 RepID=A0ABT1ADI3_9PSEU|nr:zinc-binding dehydrogenase [Pseudonocardia humida]MCO1661135.1 zinc-binding dehydrogenase [Pseudonocardia humida]